MIFNILKAGYRKVSSALSKTRHLLGAPLRKLLGNPLDKETLEEIEALLYQADLGTALISEVIDSLKSFAKSKSNPSIDDYLQEIERKLLTFLRETPPLKEAPKGTPTVYLIVGVNGNGKTTTIGRLGHRFTKEGKKVLLAAADTFRAAATEQLEAWSERIGCEIVKGQHNSDPAAVAFDAIAAAKGRQVDITLIDTAGRLQTKTELMRELEKIKRSCNKSLNGAPHETLLILDATTGQNALEQARIFNQYTPITGLILTKLDGSTKGGIALAIQKELDIPIHFIGTGEGIEDLEPFQAEAFIHAML